MIFATRTARRRRGARGSASVAFALLLVVLLGFVALVIDVGHFFQVKGELQNAADSAALAGVRDLNGESSKFGVAISSAQTYSAMHLADATPVTVPAGDVVLGKWDFSAHTFTPGTTPAPAVNAVQVTTRRTAATGNPVQTFFAIFLGKTEQDVTATAIAVGGGPAAACITALAVPDCSIYDAAGNLRCGATLTFRSADDNVAFTLGDSTNPNTPAIECAFARTLGYTPCPSGCNCANSCLSSSLSTIRIANGNNLSNTMISYINYAVTNNPSGVFVQMPVARTGLTTNCAKYPLSNLQTVAGFVTMRITGATSAPDKQIQTTIDCTHSEDTLPAGGFYGYTSTKIYLGR